MDNIKITSPQLLKRSNKRIRAADRGAPPQIRPKKAAGLKEKMSEGGMTGSMTAARLYEAGQISSRPHTTRKNNPKKVAFRK